MEIKPCYRYDGRSKYIGKSAVTTLPSITKPGAIWHWWGNGTSEIDSNYFSTTIQSKIPISSSLVLSNPSSESSVDSFFALDLPFHFPAPFCQAFLCLVTSSASQTPINSTTIIKCFPSITRLLPLMLFFLHCNTAFQSIFSFSRMVLHAWRCMIDLVQ